jgi:hypothetical protein
MSSVVVAGKCFIWMCFLMNFGSQILEKLWAILHWQPNVPTPISGLLPPQLIPDVCLGESHHPHYCTTQQEFLRGKCGVWRGSCTCDVP